MSNVYLKDTNIDDSSHLLELTGDIADLIGSLVDKVNNSILYTSNYGDLHLYLDSVMTSYYSDGASIKLRIYIKFLAPPPLVKVIELIDKIKESLKFERFLFQLSGVTYRGKDNEMYLDDGYLSLETGLVYDPNLTLDRILSGHIQPLDSDEFISSNSIVFINKYYYYYNRQIPKTLEFEGLIRNVHRTNKNITAYINFGYKLRDREFGEYFMGEAK